MTNLNINDHKKNDNLNNGKSIDYSYVLKHKEKAAKDFAEGNIYLEELLLTCFNNHVVTKGCCVGREKHSPYIAFDNIPENKPYINNIIASLAENKYIISYVKGEYNGLFSICQEDGNMIGDDLFEKVNNIIKSTNTKENYQDKLPKHLLEWQKVFEYDTTDSNKIFQISYQKINNNYTYKLITTIQNYNYYAKKMDFIPDSKGSFIIPHKFSTKDQDLAALKLEYINRSIKNLNQLYNTLLNRIPNNQTPENLKIYTEADIEMISSIYEEYLTMQEQKENTNMTIYTPFENPNMRAVKIFHTGENSDYDEVRTIFTYQDGTKFDQQILPLLIKSYASKGKIVAQNTKTKCDGSRGFYLSTLENGNSLSFANIKTDIMDKSITEINRINNKIINTPTIQPTSKEKQLVKKNGFTNVLLLAFITGIIGGIFLTVIYQYCSNI